jgi:hypothetical protein
MISQVLVYECDYCGHTESEKVQCDMTALHQTLFTIPPGWKFVGRKVACPNHVVVVKTVHEFEEVDRFLGDISAIGGLGPKQSETPA